MRLLNGRGQLGEALKPYSNKNSIVDLYHSWIFDDKTYQTQAKQFDKFRDYFFSRDKERKPVFISTGVAGSGPYFDFKKLAERCIEDNCSNYLIIRLPNIIGKGIFTKFRDEDVKPYGVIDFLSMDETVEFILQNALIKTGIITPPSWSISAETLKKLVGFIKQ